MKKSKIALGVIAVLAAGWIGGAWYTGKKAETEYQKQIAVANEKLKKELLGSGYTVQIDVPTFSRGIFTSDISYDLLILDESKATESTKIPFSGKLYHGPLPLDQLAKFNFTPVIFSSSFVLANNADTKSWFDATKGKSPFEAVAALGYDLKSKGSFKVNAGEKTNEASKFIWSDATINYHLDKTGIGKVDVNIANLNALIENNSDDTENENKNIQFELKDFNVKNVKTDLTATEWKNILAGSQQGKIGLLSMILTDKQEQKQHFAFKDWDFSYQTTVKDKFVNSDVKNKLADISLNEHSLGALQADLQMNHLQADALNVILEASQSLEPQFNADVQNALQKLAENQPQLTFAPITLTNAGGKADINLNIELAHADTSKILRGKVLSLFKQLQFKADVDKAAIESVIAVLAQAEGISKEESQALAKGEVEQLINELKQAGFIVEQDNKVISTIMLENNELKLNGTVIPEDSLSILLLGAVLGR